jgi:nucleoside-diphosphate-sugar epimerase
MQAARGVDTVIYALGVPYTEFQLYPKLMRAAVDAAAAAGVQRFVVVTGVYSYGIPQTQRVAETHPRVPVAVKGQLRKEQEDILMAAGERGLFKSMVVRLPDFYGPYADNSLANPIFRAALAGKTANWLGPVGPLHEFVFVPDVGPVIAELAARDDCYGEAWNFAGPGEISAGIHPEDLPGGGTRAEIPQRRPHHAAHAGLVQSVDARVARDVISAGDARAAGRREAAGQAGAGAQDEL